MLVGIKIKTKTGLQIRGCQQDVPKINYFKAFKLHNYFTVVHLEKILVVRISFQN